MSRHGRGIIPFGTKYRGVRLSLVPDDYLSFLTTCEWLPVRFDWLFESLLAELAHRGLRADLCSGSGDCGEQVALRIRCAGVCSASWPTELLKPNEDGVRVIPPHFAQDDETAARNAARDTERLQSAFKSLAPSLKPEIVPPRPRRAYRL